jgi:allantoinase
MKDGFDLVVRGARIVTPEGLLRADFGVKGGKFVRIGADIEGAAVETVEAGGLVAFPGIIDSHVHFNEPGRTHWEGFASGSAALAAGGGTMFFDMPLNSLPPVTDAASLALKRAAGERSSMLDFALWGGLVPGNLEKLAEMRDAGVIGLKAFMCNSGVEEFPASDAATLRAGMKRAAALGMLVAVHAEDDALASKLTEQQHAKGTDVRTWLASRPVELELAAIRMALELAGETGCALHIVHVSSPEGDTLVQEARRRGVDVTVETCPHYLLLTEEDVVRLGAPAKCYPILRSEAGRLGLWRNLEEGGIDTVGSDHSPAPPERKQEADFFEIWGGISGCQHGFQLLISEAISRRPEEVALPRLAQVLASTVARRFRIEARKGRIAEGLDADFSLLDTHSDQVLSNADVFYRHCQGPYDGRRSRVRIVRTVARGRTVYANGRVASVRPKGHFIRP